MYVHRENCRRPLVRSRDSYQVAITQRYIGCHLRGVKDGGFPRDSGNDCAGRSVEKSALIHLSDFSGEIPRDNIPAEAEFGCYLAGFQ
jgi:hypothetical protein